MVKIYNKSELIKEDLKRVRDFVKDYKTDNLAIIFTKKWKQLIKIEGKYKWLTIKKSTTGIFNYGNGYLFGIGGVKNVELPAIVVNTTYIDWWNTFLHEFGHYQQFMTEGLHKFQNGKEDFANTFAESFKNKKEDTNLTPSDTP